MRPFKILDLLEMDLKEIDRIKVGSSELAPMPYVKYLMCMPDLNLSFGQHPESSNLTPSSLFVNIITYTGNSKSIESFAIRTTTPLYKDIPSPGNEDGISSLFRYITQNIPGYKERELFRSIYESHVREIIHEKHFFERVKEFDSERDGPDAYVNVTINHPDKMLDDILFSISAGIVNAEASGHYCLLKEEAITGISPKVFPQTFPSFPGVKPKYCITFKQDHCEDLAGRYEEYQEALNHVRESDHSIIRKDGSVETELFIKLGRFLSAITQEMTKRHLRVLPKELNDSGEADFDHARNIRLGSYDISEFFPIYMINEYLKTYNSMGEYSDITMVCNESTVADASSKSDNKVYDNDVTLLMPVSSAKGRVVSDIDFPGSISFKIQSHEKLCKNSVAM